jgi:predicted dehydrogenase
VEAKRPIRVGLIGCGSIAGDHIRGYKALPADLGVLDAVADADEHRRAEAAELAGVAKTYSDYRELLADPEIDAVDICLPHHMHRDAIVAAAAAGKHIMSEKPLCLTLDEAAEISAAVQTHGVTLMCAHNQLFFPAVRRARELIDEGFCGELHKVRTSDSFYVDFRPETVGWRGQKSKSGGGELIDTGYHPLYLLLHLAGSEPVEVAALLSNHRLHFLEGEDSAQVLVRFAGGAVGAVETSWAHDPAGDEKFSVVGSEGAIWSDGGTLWKRRRGGPVTVEQLGLGDTFVSEVAHFVTSLQRGTRPIETEVEGARVLAVILAAYGSGEERSFVPVAASPAVTRGV